MNEPFDVFLSHNSKDKPMVRQLAQALQARGLRVWLDEEQLIPGRPWRELLERIIQTARTAAVLVGKDGLGPWEIPEMDACLSQFVDRHLPVIPVLLPGAPVKPELPLFLHRFTWIDLRGGLTDDGLGRLQWGITGVKPEPKPIPPTQTLRQTLPVEMKIPPGVFIMGSPDSDQQANADEKPPRKVIVSGFFMGCFPVTRQLYQEILRDSPVKWQGERNGLLPANYVTWFDAVTFCNMLSIRNGLRPCYRIEREQVNWDKHSSGYRLPTEAEWEYAVRAGETALWFFGENPEELERYAWFIDNSAGQIHIVGQKEPNSFGLHDMLGNVWEWCWDWYGDYDSTFADDRISSTNRVRRVLRGGSFEAGPSDLRSAARYKAIPTLCHPSIGFRYVRSDR